MELRIAEGVFVISAIVLLLQLDTVSSFRCFICNSKVDENCETLSGEQYLLNCSDAEHTACRKMDQWIDFDVGEQKKTRRVVRQCSRDTDKDRTCYYKAGLGARVNVCHCFDEGCNGSNTKEPILLSVIISIGLAIKSVL